MLHPAQTKFLIASKELQEYFYKTFTIHSRPRAVHKSFCLLVYKLT